jgi:hypothetical protein
MWGLWASDADDDAEAAFDNAGLDTARSASRSWDAARIIVLTPAQQETVVRVGASCWTALAMSCVCARVRGRRPRRDDNTLSRCDAEPSHFSISFVHLINLYLF